jgi:hypothetical protein
MDRDDLLSLIERPGAALLDGWSDAGRWTIALPDPAEEAGSKQGRTAASTISWRRRRVPAAMRGRRPSFARGWVGFLSYELGAAWEGLCLASSGRRSRSRSSIGTHPAGRSTRRGISFRSGWRGE